MHTPVDTSKFRVNSTQKRYSFGYPLQQISMYNNGPNDINVKFGNSGFKTIRPSAGIDMEVPYGINSFSAVTDSGYADLDFIGVRKEQIETFTTLNNDNNIQKVIYYPYPIRIQQETPTNGFNSMPVLILLGIIAIVAITAIFLKDWLNGYKH